MSDVIDHQALGASRFALRYSEAARLRAFVDELLKVCNELEIAFQTLALMKDIDSAFGAHLDVIGSIVGASRILPASLALRYFGFSDGGASADIFGEEGAEGVGSRLYDEGEQITATTVLEDPEYKLLIRAKIVRNHSKANGDSVLEGLAYLFGPAPVSVTNLGSMRMGIGVGRVLSFQEQAMITQIDILPRPSGVTITNRVMYAGTSFGFADSPVAAPFGEEGMPTVGAIFAEEF